MKILLKFCWWIKVTKIRGSRFSASCVFMYCGSVTPFWTLEKRHIPCPLWHFCVSVQLGYLLSCSRSVMFDSLPLHGLQDSRLPCPSPSPRACSNTCPLSQWCHPTLILCHSLLLLCLIFSSIRIFSNESILCIRWPKYWSFSFSISPSNKYSGLISFGIDWFDLLAVQGTLKSLL